MDCLRQVHAVAPDELNLGRQGTKEGVSFDKSVFHSS